jgi:transposase
MDLDGRSDHGLRDIFGVSGMAMLKALVRNDSTPQQMTQLAKKLLRKKLPELELALEGRVEDHHRFILQMQLARLEQLDERIDAKLAPYREHHTRLTVIPGIDRVIAATIVAELGTDMSVFKSAAHLAAWAGVCPGNNESAGKRKRGPARKGNVHLMTALVEAAHGASSTRGSFLRDKFHRLKARRGYQRAAVAIAHKILTAVFAMLSTGADYCDLGAAYLDSIDAQRVTANLVRRLERLGYEVAITKRPDDGSPDGPAVQEPVVG